MAKKKTTSKKAPPKTQRRIPLHITDTTLRDAHQSLWATRMRTDDILKIIDVVDSVGYYSLEMWGGATFDVCMRFLRENPWERLRQIKARAKKTPLQMLLRGQNVLGYRNYPDDLLEHFVGLACENGIDIFRIFDALNDTRNLEHAITCVKRYGGHAQGTLSYTTSPVHTVKEYLRVAKEQVQLGIDSLCIKDMAGILSPIAAEELVSALAKEIKVPIQLHCHATSGMAIATYVEGVRAGAGAIDCAISPMAGYQSQPPVETMLAIFDEMPYHATLDIDALKQVCKYFLGLKKERTLRNQVPENVIDPDILIHHIPGGMISNLRSQLVKQNALDRIDEVFQELPRVRKDLGYPPLVTPTSQIIGTQSVMNVLLGKRYEMVPKEVKDYVKGLYGRPPAKIDPKVKKKILGNEKTIRGRPADLLEPMLPKATEGVGPGLIKNEEDIISYCLFPEPSLEYFKWRKLPEKKRPPCPADIEYQEDRAAAAREDGEAAAAVEPIVSHEDYQSLHGLLDKLKGLNFDQLAVRTGDVSFQLSDDGVARLTVGEDELLAAPAPKKQKKSAKTEKTAKKTKAAPKGPTINAPLSGTFYSSPSAGKPAFVKAGDTVAKGKPVCIVEAMKLFNEVKATDKCKIIDILVEHGAEVEKDQPLVSYEKA
jgi:oxaloacetate decarboxylase alpha subunit